MLVFGGLGYLMVRYQWPRAPLVLGLVLGDVAERYLWISVARYGTAWLGRPVVVVLLTLTVGIVLSTLLQQRRAAREAVHATQAT
jgi:TctA family transporter